MKKLSKIFIIKIVDFKKFLWYNIRALRLRERKNLNEKIPKIFIIKLVDFIKKLWYNKV